MIVGDKMVIDPDQEVEDRQLADPQVEVSARILRQVMDEIVEGIKFTTETRNDFREEWGVPTLDTTWRMNEGPGGSRRLVEYRYYKKPVSTRFLTPFKSAQAI